ncbi:MAG: hypothetical protein AAF532_00215 [Planctomycetota bacterium]
MSKLPLIITAITIAAFSWGLYVPAVHKAASANDGLDSNLRAFLFVGLAYFLVAVVVPLVVIFALNADFTAGSNPNFGLKGMGWGLFAGTLGAAGALAVIFAVKTAGPPWGPLYVAPLVFAGAPIINTLASITIFAKGGTKTPDDPRFYGGLVLAAVGAVLVMIYKPSGGHGKKQTPVAAESAEVASAEPLTAESH